MQNLCALISSNYTKLKVRVIKKLEGISSTNVYVTIGNNGYVAKIIFPSNEKLIYKICYVSRLLKANSIPAPSILPTRIANSPRSFSASHKYVISKLYSSFRNPTTF